VRILVRRWLQRVPGAKCRLSNAEPEVVINRSGFRTAWIVTPPAEVLRG
jgi:hypothetical protein